MISLASKCSLLQNFINGYKLTMFSQYLVLLEATNLRKSRENVKAVHSPQVNKAMMSLVHLLVSALFSKNAFYEKASVSALFLLCS